MVHIIVGDKRLEPVGFLLAAVTLSQNLGSQNSRLRCLVALGRDFEKKSEEKSGGTQKNMYKLQ